jgi:4-amino-4-deoxy-L-arabinose transferase-like glycosyltransferase
MSDEVQVSGRLSEGTPILRAVARCLAWRPGARVPATWQWTAGLSALLASVVVLPAAAIALSRGFDGLYGQDPYAYFDYATMSVRQSILGLKPLEPFFWPPGYPLLVALASFSTGATPLAGQLVSLPMGALVPVFTFLLAGELFPEHRALPALAGLLAALPGQLWQSSIVVMADTTGLALATFSAWSLVRYARGGCLAWLVIAGAVLAYATLSRWIYGLLSVPFTTYALWAIHKHAKPGRALLHAAVGLAVPLAMLGPLLGPSLLGLLSDPAEPAAFAGNLQVYSWSPLNALRRDFLTIDGHLSYALPNGLYYAVAPANLAFFGPLLAAGVLLGLWAAIRGWPRHALLLIVGWAGVVYVFHAGAPWQNFRFALAYLPPLAILAAAGLVWAWPRRPVRLQAAVAVLATLGVLSTAVAGVRLVDGFVDRKDDELALARWVQAQTEPGAQLLSFGPTLTLRHYTNLPTFDLFDLTSTDLTSILANQAPTYVLVDESSLENQWRGQAPDVNFLSLGAQPGLESLGARGNYALFRVASR